MDLVQESRPGRGSTTQVIYAPEIVEHLEVRCPRPHFHQKRRQSEIDPNEKVEQRYLLNATLPALDAIHNKR